MEKIRTPPLCLILYFLAISALTASTAIAQDAPGRYPLPIREPISQPKDLIRLPPIEEPLAQTTFDGTATTPSDIEVAWNLTSASSSSSTASAAADNARSESKPIGEAPPDNARVFLRQSAVLLKPGTFEVEWGIRYTLQETDFVTLLPDTSLVPENLDVRTVLGTLTVRYGLSERWQPYITVPVGASMYERANELIEYTDQHYGLGDIVVGTNFLVRDGKDECADIIFGLSVIAPTGLPAIGLLDQNVASLGSGFTTINTSLTAVQTFDPLVLFGTIGYDHQFSRNFNGLSVQPGEQFNYAFGVGFAVNDNITLSAQYQSIFQLDFSVNGVQLPNSSLESSMMRYSVIRQIGKQAFVELYLLDGLTSDAPRTSVGILSTRRY